MMPKDTIGNLDSYIARGALCFDANIACVGEKCTIEVNEDL